jgi:uncharacterized protein YdaU (DUF1376 family)
MSQPFMPLFFGDFLASTPTWDGEERGLYLLLLAYQWSAGPLPTDTKRLAKMTGYDHDKFQVLWLNVVRSKFEETATGLVNARLEDHRLKSLAISKKRAEVGKAGAAKRWQADSNCHEVANGKTMPSIPNQTIPIQSILEDRNPPSPPKGGKRATQMPEGFSAKESHAELAMELGVNLQSEFVAFADFHSSKGNTFKDWDAALRTWLRNAKKFAQNTKATVNKESNYDRFMRLNGGPDKRVIDHE